MINLLVTVDLAKKDSLEENVKKVSFFYLKNWCSVFKIVLTFFDKTLRKKIEI